VDHGTGPAFIRFLAAIEERQSQAATLRVAVIGNLRLNMSHMEMVLLPFQQPLKTLR
jgi:hypothetical protein